MLQCAVSTYLVSELDGHVRCAVCWPVHRAPHAGLSRRRGGRDSSVHAALAPTRRPRIPPHYSRITMSTDRLGVHRDHQIATVRMAWSTRVHASYLTLIPPPGQVRLEPLRQICVYLGSRVTETPVGLRLDGKRGCCCRRRQRASVGCAAYRQRGRRTRHLTVRNPGCRASATPESPWNSGEYRDGDLDGAGDIAATDDSTVVAEAEARRIRRRGTAVTWLSSKMKASRSEVLVVASTGWSAPAIRSAIHEALQHHRGDTGDRARRSRARRRRARRSQLTVPRSAAARAGRCCSNSADRDAPELLAELAPHIEVIDAAKIPYGRAQDAINAVLIERPK